MKGRKPKANAARRGGSNSDGAEIIEVKARTKEELAEAGIPGIEKPADIAASPSMSHTWDAIVGRGLVFQACDAPFVSQLVHNVEVANQAWAKCTEPDGSMKLVIGRGEPDENGEYTDYKPNPYIKIANDAAALALRLADQMGCTPLARARLGLTEALGTATNISIAKQIDAAIGGRQ